MASTMCHLPNTWMFCRHMRRIDCLFQRIDKITSCDWQYMPPLLRMLRISHCESYQQYNVPFFHPESYILPWHSWYIRLPFDKSPGSFDRSLHHSIPHPNASVNIFHCCCWVHHWPMAPYRLKIRWQNYCWSIMTNHHRSVATLTMC